MLTCPNKNLQSWKDLVFSKGENMAYYLWNKYKGEVSEGSKKDYKKSTDVLNKTLEDFLTQFGFTTEQLDDLKEVTGYSIIGATDFLEKTIFVQKKNIDKAYSKEAAYVIFNLLGKKNLLRKDLIASIHLIDNYENFKSKYINSKLSDYKIRELIAVDYLQNKLIEAHKEALTTKKEVASKDVTAKNKIEYIILKIKKWWADIIRNFFKSYKKGIVENAFNQIANDVINNNTRLFNTAKKVSYSKMELEGKVKEINNSLVKLGAINSGSYALNKQGTLTREKVSDLDYFLPYDIKDDFIKNVAKIYPQTKFSKPYAGVMGNRALTLSLSIDDVKIDLFLPTSQEESDKNKIVIIDGIKYHHWKNIFDAKIRIGSQKHLSDLAGFVPFQKENLIFNKEIEDKNNEIDNKIESIKKSIQNIKDNFSWGTANYSRKYDLENELENLVKQKQSFILEKDTSLSIVGQRHYNFDFVQSKFNKKEYTSKEKVVISNNIKSYWDTDLEKTALNYFKDNNIDFEKSNQYRDLLKYFQNNKTKAITFYYLTFSENFKKFFGNIPSRKNVPSFIINYVNGNYSKPSILLDENGEPVIFYHGAGTIFDKFSKDYFLSGEGAMAYGAGFYATNYKPTADNYRDTAKKAIETYQKLLFEQNQELLDLISKLPVEINLENLLGLMIGSLDFEDFETRTSLLNILGLTETKALYIALTNPLFWDEKISLENKNKIEQEFGIKLKNEKSGQIYRELEKRLNITDKEVSARLYQIGIDGVIRVAKGGMAVGGFTQKKGELHAIFFEPIQAKAVNNSGLFSLNNENMYDPISIQEEETEPTQVPQTEVKKPTTEIKPGVEELFDSNPELASIGTPQQYSQYLDTIFPDSKVKDIVYHGTDLGKDVITFKTDRGGIFLASTPIYASYFSKDDNAYPALINFKNIYKAKGLTDNIGKEEIKQIKSKGYDSVIGKGGISKMQQHQNDLEFIAFEPEQIHILGTKQDIEGFKSFIEKTNLPKTTDTFEESKEIIKFTSQKDLENLKKGKPC